MSRGPGRYMSQGMHTPLAPGNVYSGRVGGTCGSRAGGGHGGWEHGRRCAAEVGAPGGGQHLKGGARLLGTLGACCDPGQPACCPPAGSAAGEHVVTAGRRQDPEGSVSRRCCSKGHATPPRASRKQAHCQLAALKETRTTYLHCSKTMRTAMPSFRALSNEQHALRCQAIVASTNNLGRIYGSKGTCRSALLILRRPRTRQVCNADENIRAA